MEYEAKYKLNDNQYIATLTKGGEPYAMAVVTTNDEGKPVRWLIFKKD